MWRLKSGDISPLVVVKLRSTDHLSCMGRRSGGYLMRIVRRRWRSGGCQSSVRRRQAGIDGNGASYSIVLFCKELPTSSLTTHPANQLSVFHKGHLKFWRTAQRDWRPFVINIVSTHKKIARASCGCKVLFERGTAIRTLQNQVLSIRMQVQI